MKKPKLKVSDISLDIQDAVTPLTYVVEERHARRAKSKAGKPFNLCVQENAINAIPGVLDCKFHRTVAQVIFKKHPHIAIRYVPTSDGKRIAELNDKFGSDGLLKELTFPLELQLNPPRPARSLKHLRSDKMKKTRKESAARRAGKPKRKYTSPTKKGFRNGTGVGRAHIWAANAA